MPTDPMTGSLVLNSPVTLLIIQCIEMLYVAQRKSYVLCVSECKMNGEQPACPSTLLPPLVSLWLQLSPLCKFLLFPMGMVRQSLAISRRESLIVPISTGAPGGETQRPVKRGPIKSLPGSARQCYLGGGRRDVPADCIYLCFLFLLWNSIFKALKEKGSNSQICGLRCPYRSSKGSESHCTAISTSLVIVPHSSCGSDQPYSSPITKKASVERPRIAA